MRPATHASKAADGTARSSAARTWQLRASLLGLLLAVALGGAAPEARASSSLLFGFTDNAPLSVGSRATGPALTLGARGFAYALVWQPGKTSLTAAENTGLSRAIVASSGTRVVLVVRTDGATAPLSDLQQQQFCAYTKSAVSSFPLVNDVVVGNEANAPYFWRPQFTSTGSPASPAAYETLLARCYDVLHTFRATIDVGAFGLDPHGNDNPNAVSNSSISPINFIRGVAAAYRASGRTTRIFDTVVHHPYGYWNYERPYATHAGPFFVGEGDWSKLVGTLQSGFAGTPQAVPGHCLPPAPCVPLWYLETGFQTAPKVTGYYGSENVFVVPDVAAPEAQFPAPPVTSKAPDQVTQLRSALRLAYCQPYVTAYFNFLIRDDPNLTGYQSGVLWANWQPKGSYTALGAVVHDVQTGNVSCTAPTAPGRPATQVLAGPARVSLTWAPSASPIGVSGYRVYRNGALLGTSDDPSYVDGDVAASGDSSYTIRAFDAAGQTSDASPAAAVPEAAVAAVATPATRQSVSCGSLKVHSRSFRIQIVLGRVTCSVARAAIRVFVVRHHSPKRWHCLRGHGASWTVACANPRRGHVRVVVRAFRR